MTRRFLALLLALVMVFTMCACGESKDSATDTTNDKSAAATTDSTAEIDDLKKEIASLQEENNALKEEVETLKAEQDVTSDNSQANDDIINKVKFFADGKEVSTDSIIRNGTIFLPITVVANAIGKDFYWDGPNFTAYLGEMNGNLEQPTMLLEDMTSIDEKMAIVSREKDLVDNYGNTYNKAIYNSRVSCNLEFLLNMKYSKFKGTLYVPEGESAENSVHLQVIADGKIIYTSPDLNRSSKPVPVDVNVTGCNDVKIQFSTEYNTMAGHQKIMVCLGDAGFYQ